MFRGKHVFFKTRVFRDGLIYDGKSLCLFLKTTSHFNECPPYEYKCSFSLSLHTVLFIPRLSENLNGKVGIILRTEDYAPTHKNGEIALRMNVCEGSRASRMHCVCKF